MRIVFLGAGSIGCFIGGCWQKAGLEVGFVGRRKIAGEIAANGLTLTDHTGWKLQAEAGEIEFTDDPSLLSRADLIAISVKSPATAEATAIIGAHAADGAPVLSLQNGISNVDILQGALPAREIIPGMVGFNVARTGPGHWHKGTSGDLICGRSSVTEEIARLTVGSPAELTVVPDMAPIAWGKLLLNLNNAINALSGLSLVEELSERDFRKVLAASIREAVSVIEAAGIRPAKVAALPPRLLAPFIDTPDWFFRSIGLRLQKIDANARSSMADDFAAGRPTEIDYLNGEIVRLAGQQGLAAPVNAKIVELVKQTEAGGKQAWTGKELATKVGL